MNTMTDEDRTRALEVLCRRQRIWRSPLFRVLRHPLRTGYPTPSRLRRWRRIGHSVQVQAPTPWGQRMTVTLPDDVSVFLHRNGFFEYELSAFYLRFLRRGMTFVDIGAHMGYFSMLASRAVGRTGRVLAFEPTPSTFRVLMANTGTEHNVTQVNKAAWSKTSTLTLHDYGPCFSAFNSFFDPRLPDSDKARLSDRTHLVPAVRLDDFVRDEGCVPDAVKIDAESAELHVLDGMRQLLSGPRPVLSIEVGDMGVPDAPRSREVVDKVLSFDYRAFEMRDGRVLPHQVREEYDYENILFAPAERSHVMTGMS